MKLQCLKPFNEQGLCFTAGSVVEVSEAMGHYLLSNYPACFARYAEPVEPPAAPDAPPADKMIRRGRTVRK